MSSIPDSCNPASIPATSSYFDPKVLATWQGRALPLLAQEVNNRGLTLIQMVFAVCFDKSIVVVFNGGIVGRVGRAAASNALCRGFDADSAQEVWQWTPV